MPEYIGTAGFVNKNLGFVRKAEKTRGVVWSTRPMYSGTTVALTCLVLIIFSTVVI